MKTLRLAAAAALFALPATADEFTAGPLTIGHPVIFAAPPTARAVAGYMTIANAGGADDRLTGAEIGGDARAELHRSVMESGVMRMIEQEEGIAIPAGGTTELAPGGFHVMILGLDEVPAEGDSLEATLTFEEAGPVEITFTVEPRPTGETMGHDADGTR